MIYPYLKKYFAFLVVSYFIMDLFVSLSIQFKYVPLYLEWAPVGVFSSALEKTDNKDDHNNNMAPASNSNKSKSEMNLPMVSKFIVIVLVIYFMNLTLNISYRFYDLSQHANN